MIIAVQGHKNFSDYETFMRAMGVALSQLGEEEVIEVWSAGPHKINSFTAAFCNSAENYLKQKGHKIRFKKVTSGVISDNLLNISYFAYFSSRNDPFSKLVAEAELADVEVGIYRY